MSKESNVLQIFQGMDEQMLKGCVTCVILDVQKLVHMNIHTFEFLIWQVNFEESRK